MGELDAPEKTRRKRIFFIFTYFSAAGTVLGALGAYIYYQKWGCTSGNCAITSNPWLSTLWGAVMGFLIGDILSPLKKKDNTGDKSTQ
jgi:hypothetical protein